MLKRTHYIGQLQEAKGRVVISGWVHDVKETGRLTFIWVRDRTGLAQVTVLKQKAPRDVLDISKELGSQDVIAVEGNLVEERIAKVGPEIMPDRIEIVARSERTLPIDLTGKSESNLDTRLDWRSLDLRRPESLAIFKIQAKLVEGMESYLRENGFIQVFTPCFIGGTSEGGAEVFKTDYFGKEAYLRQDPQLHRQLLIVGGFDKIFDLGPNWRAEASHTPRHTCEHRGCAVELGFIEDESDTMRVEENLIAASLRKVAEECEKDLKLLNKEIRIPKTPFPELRFPDIYEILSELGKKIQPGEDYDRESEVLLSRYVVEQYDSEFFFVNRFPFKFKPFYVMRVDEDPTWARSVDLVFKGLEQSSGGQREHRHAKIVQQIEEKGTDPESMSWFIEPFKYGAPPHGGFCLGLERLTMALLDLRNIREAVLFPRTPERLLP